MSLAAGLSNNFQESNRPEVISMTKICAFLTLTLP